MTILFNVNVFREIPVQTRGRVVFVTGIIALTQGGVIHFSGLNLPVYPPP